MVKTAISHVPNAITKVIANSGDSAPLLIHMTQIHIYYLAYIETFWPILNIETFRTAQFQFLGKTKTRATPFILAFSKPSTT
jgi:hypothetical protein